MNCAGPEVYKCYDVLLPGNYKSGNRLNFIFSGYDISGNQKYRRRLQSGKIGQQKRRIAQGRRRHVSAHLAFEVSENLTIGMLLERHDPVDQFRRSHPSPAAEFLMFFCDIDLPHIDRQPFDVTI